jgi:phenylpyruvate tautomerase PptA (4-oxalocrotonate tautomerase family)
MLSHHNDVPETQMPYLQLDVNEHYSVADKRLLAKEMSETYARMMSVDIRRISVAIRELGDGGVWRIAEAGSDPVPVSVMMLDIRRGRPPELRMEVAKALCKHCLEILSLREDRVNVEFTQHSSDEMYHPALGGYSTDWEPGEQ